MAKKEKIGTIYTLVFPNNDYIGLETMYNVFGIYFNPISEEEKEKVEKILKKRSWNGCEDRTIRVRLIDGCASINGHWFQERIARHLEAGCRVIITE